MDTRFLETLVTVVECGSLAEAARRLNLTAAAVAQRIQALEAEIGIALLARSGRTVHPTTAAVAVLGRARAIQREIRDLKSVAASGILSGELRLGVVPSMLTGFLPDVLARFSTSHPQIELRIARGDSAEVYRDLMDERTDVAITSEPPFAIPKTCEWSLLREEPYVVLASATIMGRDPLAILRQEPFIRLHRKLHAGQAIDRYLRKKSICPIERFELDGSRRLRSWWIAVSVSRCSRTMRHLAGGSHTTQDTDFGSVDGPPDRTFMEKSVAPYRSHSRVCGTSRADSQPQKPPNSTKMRVGAARRRKSGHSPDEEPEVAAE
jgi:DNA-binding transcriptional LysR family regulator